MVLIAVNFMLKYFSFSFYLLLNELANHLVLVETWTFARCNIFLVLSTLVTHFVSHCLQHVCLYFGVYMEYMGHGSITNMEDTEHRYVAKLILGIYTMKSKICHSTEPNANVEPMLEHCRSIVNDAGPTINQHWFNVCVTSTTLQEWSHQSCTELHIEPTMRDTCNSCCQTNDGHRRYFRSFIKCNYRTGLPLSV